MQSFMRGLGLDRRHGAWFRQYQVDPISDSVIVHQWLTWATNSSLSAFRQPGSVALGLTCVGKNQSFILKASDTTLNLPRADVWVRYRVDQNPASDWHRVQGGLTGQYIVAALDSVQSAALLEQMTSGRDKVVIRVRAGLTERQEDFYFMTNGFLFASLECLAATTR